MANCWRIRAKFAVDIIRQCSQQIMFAVKVRVMVRVKVKVILLHYRAETE